VTRLFKSFEFHLACSVCYNQSTLYNVKCFPHKCAQNLLLGRHRMDYLCEWQNVSNYDIASWSEQSNLSVSDSLDLLPDNIMEYLSKCTLTGQYYAVANRTYTAAIFFEFFQRNVILVLTAWSTVLGIYRFGTRAACVLFWLGVTKRPVTTSSRFSRTSVRKSFSCSSATSDFHYRQ